MSHLAAAATLSPTDRAQALMLREGAERLELARGALGEQRGLLEELMRGVERSVDGS